MNLTADDLQAIRAIFQEEVRLTVQTETQKVVQHEVMPSLRQLIKEEISAALQKELTPIKGELAAIGNDIKEIYSILVANCLKVNPI